MDRFLARERMRERSGRGLALRRPDQQGFTLVELIVVIAIITILMALLAVFVVGVLDRAANAKAKAIVDGLDKACQTYRLENNVYPPNDKGGDSRCLHYYLGRTRLISKGRMDDGNSIVVKAPPIIEFPQDWLKLAKGQVPDATQPVPIVDPWDNLIRYVPFPGKFNKKGVDIWSPGKNGVDDLANDLADGSGQSDDICNWVKEY
jgi:prepilin-type N-terminal cleavage/methylation domain-containing protein